VRGELQQARRAAASGDISRNFGPGSLAAPIAESLRHRLSTHEKERKAIHTIVESKIKALTDNIVAFLGQGQNASSSSSSSAEELVQVRERAAREARALQRLVNASVSALRNAESEAQRAAKRESDLEQ